MCSITNINNKLVFWMRRHKTDAYSVKCGLLTACLSDCTDLFMEKLVAN